MSDSTKYQIQHFGKSEEREPTQLRLITEKNEPTKENEQEQECTGK